MIFTLAASASPSLSLGAPESRTGSQPCHDRRWTRVGWVGRRPGFKGRALLIERQWKKKPTHPKLSSGDAGEVSYYNLEKQPPVKSCFFLRRKGGRCGPRGSCTRPSSMQAPGEKRDHTIGHHQQAAYCFSKPHGLAIFFFSGAVGWVSQRAAIAQQGGRREGGGEG